MLAWLRSDARRALATLESPGFGRALEGARWPFVGAGAALRRTFAIDGSKFGAEPTEYVVLGLGPRSTIAKARLSATRVLSRGSERLPAVPTAVHDEIHAVHRRVLEQEYDRVDDVGHGCQPSRGRLRSVVLDGGRLLRPGLSPTIPGWSELARSGFISSTSVRVSPTIPRFTLLTVVEPGYGRSLAMPPNNTSDPSSVSRDRLDRSRIGEIEGHARRLATDIGNDG